MIGPLYKVFEEKVMGPMGEDNRTESFKDSDQKKFDGTFYPEWYTLFQSHREAKRLGVPLVEV